MTRFMMFVALLMGCFDPVGLLADKLHDDVRDAETPAGQSMAIREVFWRASATDIRFIYRMIEDGNSLALSAIDGIGKFAETQKSQTVKVLSALLFESYADNHVRGKLIDALLASGHSTAVLTLIGDFRFRLNEPNVATTDPASPNPGNLALWLALLAQRFPGDLAVANFLREQTAHPNHFIVDTCVEGLGRLGGLTLALFVKVMDQRQGISVSLLNSMADRTQYLTADDRELLSQKMLEWLASTDRERQRQALVITNGQYNLWVESLPLAHRLSSGQDEELATYARALITNLQSYYGNSLTRSSLETSLQKIQRSQRPSARELAWYQRRLAGFAWYAAHGNACGESLK